MADRAPQPLTRMIRTQQYDALGHCVYCCTPSTAGPLTDEHIIPEMIGGKIVFENASCKACAEQTHAFEGHACDVYRPMRRQLGFPSKVKGKRAAARSKIEKFILQLDDRRIKVPASEFPALLTSLVFPLPRILFNLLPPNDDLPLTGGIGGIELMPEFGERLNRIRRKYRSEKVSIVGVDKSHRMDHGDYGRMLAKIAHAYAVGEAGEQRFRPFLVNIIRGIRPFHLTHFIGSQLETTEPATDLHEISIEQGTPEAARYVVVRLRLFAAYKTPAHVIVVGEWL